MPGILPVVSIMDHPMQNQILWQKMHYFLLEYVRLFFHVWLESIQLLIVEKVDTCQISKITTQIFLATKYLLECSIQAIPITFSSL